MPLMSGESVVWQESTLPAAVTMDSINLANLGSSFSAPAMPVTSSMNSRMAPRPSACQLTCWGENGWILDQLAHTSRPIEQTHPSATARARRSAPAWANFAHCPLIVSQATLASCLATHANKQISSLKCPATLKMAGNQPHEHSPSLAASMTACKMLARLSAGASPAAPAPPTAGFIKVERTKYGAGRFFNFWAFSDGFSSSRFHCRCQAAVIVQMV
jgi:hypothetical protein